MHDSDDWERDPSVMTMRKVFKGMEISQTNLFKSLQIEYHDPRLRSWRERALSIFEKAWVISNRTGITIDEKKASEIYIRCLAKILNSDGVKIPVGFFPGDVEIDSIINQIVQEE